jgi:hypothetical protein
MTDQHSADGRGAADADAGPSRRAFLRHGAIAASGLLVAPGVRIEQPSALRRFLEQYFEAWRGTAPEKTLAYFSEDAVIVSRGRGETHRGRRMIGEQWIIPAMTAFPGCTHDITGYFESGDQLSVEWTFTGVPAAGGQTVRLPGSTIYWIHGGLIRRGHLYFNPALGSTTQKPTE